MRKEVMTIAHTVRPTSRLRTLLGVAVVVLLALSATELILRTFAPLHFVGIQAAYQYDPVLGYRLQPGIHIYKLSDYLEEVQTNRLGTVNFVERFDDYPQLIFALGDSYTQGTGLAADASYPFQLDLIVNRDDRGSYVKRYAIVNLGLAAFGAEQELRTLEMYADAVGKPKYVFYLGCENDYDDDLLFLNGYRHRHIVIGSPLWGVLVRPLLWLDNLEIWKRSRLAVSQLRTRQVFGQWGRTPVMSSWGPAATGERKTVAELEWPVIQRIADQAKKDGAKLVVSWANPNLENPSAGSYGWLKEKAAQEGIAFADWYPAAQSVVAAMPDLPYENPHSGGHWRNWVNRIIAETYARYVPPTQDHPEASASAAAGAPVQSGLRP